MNTILYIVLAFMAYLVVAMIICAIHELIKRDNNGGKDFP